MTLDLWRLATLLALSFSSGLIDLSLGMGYGFTVTPVMLLLGYTTAETVPTVLFSSFMGGATSSIFNHRLRNADFTPGSRDLKIAFIMGGLGVIGAVIGVNTSLSLPERAVGLYIGSLVIASGALMLYSKSLISGFSWPKMTIISILGSFNKGISGSGFGPIITTGAIMSGLDEKTSVSIQALSETLVSLVGFATYTALQSRVDAPMIVAMSLGVTLASPFAATIVKNARGNTLRTMIGVLALIVGTSTLLKYL
jgi:uncharacterized membrane protein YfcA